MTATRQRLKIDFSPACCSALKQPEPVNTAPVGCYVFSHPLSVYSAPGIPTLSPTVVQRQAYRYGTETDRKRRSRGPGKPYPCLQSNTRSWKPGCWRVNNGLVLNCTENCVGGDHDSDGDHRAQSTEREPALQDDAYGQVASPHLSTSRISFIHISSYITFAIDRLSVYK